MDPAKRFATAAEMASALQSVVAAAPPVEVGAWVERLGGDIVRKHAARRSRGAQMSLPPPSGTGATPQDTPRLATRRKRASSRPLRAAALTAFAVAGVALALVGGLAKMSSGHAVAQPPPPPAHAVVQIAAPAEPAASPLAPPVDVTVFASTALPKTKSSVARRSSPPPRATSVAGAARTPTAEVLRALDSRR